jgi:tryptophan halogenase
MAAAQITKELPDAELFHIFDSRLPIIGVGEGTTPNLPGWLHDITGLGFEGLRERCRATMKYGTRFEGWGPDAEPFLHRFQPVPHFAYHVDARRLAELLREHIRAEVIDGRVTSLRSGAAGAALTFEDGRTLPFSYVIDARGFPAQSDEDVLAFDWIPTNAAMVKRAPVEGHSGSTRAVARPHGWIFVIPLVGYTSYGYIHNSGLSTAAEVEADFDAFLASEGATSTMDHLNLRFPNFTRRTFFDGAVFRVGNAASFIEPIEAVSIGTALVQIRAAARFIREGAARDAAPPDPAAIAAYNQAAFSYVCKNSLFISWHYAAGSRYASPFWAHAERCFARAAAHPEVAAFVADFDEFLAVARDFRMEDLAGIDDREAWNQKVFPKLKLYRPYGNFSELNVAQVGHGIGLFSRPAQAEDAPLHAPSSARLGG